MSADQVSFGAEPVAEQRIREAIEAGDFDDLPGEGEPIPGKGLIDDELWWVRKWIRRNKSDDESGSK